MRLDRTSAVNRWRGSFVAFGVLMVLLVQGLAGRAIAQNVPGQVDPLQELRIKEAFTDEDRARIGTWVDEQVAAVQAGDVVGAAGATAALRDGAKGTSAFREAYAGQVLRAVGAAYREAKRENAVRLITVLNALNEPVAYSLLIEALGSQEISVRYAAAAGLRNLRAKIAVAGGKYFSEALEALRQAALKEPVRLVLSTIYDAMNYPEVAPNPPEPKAIVEALVSVLEARSQGYASGSIKAEGAEVAGLKVAMSLRTFMTEADKKRVTAAAGRIMMHSVERYTTAEKGADGVKLPPSIRREIELMIIESEKLLRNLLGTGAEPNVTKAMERVAITDMKVEFNKWAERLKKAADVELSLKGAVPAASQPGE